MYYTLTLYIIIIIQLCLPLGDIIGHIFANIIYFVLYIVGFVITGHDLISAIWLTLIFILMTPCIKIPICNHIVQILKIETYDRNNILDRIKFYLLPF